MKPLKKEFIASAKIIVLGLVVGLGVNFVAAQTGNIWTPPAAGCVPPDCNVAAPINVGSALQVKQGGGITVNGGGLLSASKGLFGNVGINVSNPLHRLHVGGNAKITGAGFFDTFITAQKVNIGNGVGEPTLPLEVTGGGKITGKLVIGAGDTRNNMLEVGGVVAATNVMRALDFCIQGANPKCLSTIGGGGETVVDKSTYYTKHSLGPSSFNFNGQPGIKYAVKGYLQVASGTQGCSFYGAIDGVKQLHDYSLPANMSIPVAVYFGTASGSVPISIPSTGSCTFTSGEIEFMPL